MNSELNTAIENNSTFNKEDVKELRELKDKLDKIENLLSNEILKNCNKMSNHIDFVERIYDYIKYPLFYISERIKYIASWQSTITSSDISVIENQRHQTESTNQ